MRIITKIITFLFLTLSFIFGIGVMAICIKLFGAPFLKKTYEGTSWVKPSGSNKTLKMY